MRAIDRDIELALGSFEHDWTMLRRATPKDEPYWIARALAAGAVHDALIAYRTAIDAQPQPARLTLEP